MKKMLLSASALAFGAAMVASGTPAMAADGIVDGPRVHWNYSLWGKPRASSVAVTNLAEWLPKKTGGKFTMTVHWGTLSKPRAVLDGLKLGAFQGGSFCASYYPAKLSAHTGIDLPFLPITTFNQLRHVTDDYYSHPTLVAETKKWNTRYHMGSLLPPYEIVGKGEPPKSLEDWKGLRVRALGQQGKAMEKLGAVPTTVPAPEVYTSMDRGLLDAVGFAYYAHESYRTFELGSWFTNGLDIGTIACGSMYNTQAWDSLPPQYQKLLEDFKDDPAGYPAQIDAYRRTEEDLPGEFVKKGLTQVSVSKEMRDNFKDVGGRPVWDAWVEQMTTKFGYDGKALLQTILDSAEKHGKSS